MNEKKQKNCKIQLKEKKERCKVIVVVVVVVVVVVINCLLYYIQVKAGDTVSVRITPPTKVRARWTFNNSLTLDQSAFRSDLTEFTGHCSLAADRFDRADGSLFLNNGWAQMPVGNYFPNDEFTIAVWAKISSFPGSKRTLRFVEFSNGKSKNEISIGWDSNGRSFFVVR